MSVCVLFFSMFEWHFDICVCEKFPVQKLCTYNITQNRFTRMWSILEECYKNSKKFILILNWGMVRREILHNIKKKKGFVLHIFLNNYLIIWLSKANLKHCGDAHVWARMQRPATAHQSKSSTQSVKTLTILVSLKFHRDKMRNKISF